MKQAHLCGHDMAYEVQGSSGPPILLIMGFGFSSDAWKHQSDGLSDRFQVARFDNRGIHRSSAGHGRHDLDELAADAVALLDHLGWESAHLVGVSMGGMIAQHAALNYRARVRSLTLIATHAGGGLLRTFPTWAGLRLFLRANTRRGPGRMEALSELLFTTVFRKEQALAGWSPQQLAEVARASDPRIRLFHLRSILTHDTRPRLSRLAGLPTLIVRPDHDLLVPPRCSDVLHRSIPGSHLARVDAGHGVTSERAEEVNTLIAGHVQAVEGGRQPGASV